MNIAQPFYRPVIAGCIASVLIVAGCGRTATEPPTASATNGAATSRTAGSGTTNSGTTGSGTTGSAVKGPVTLQITIDDETRTVIVDDVADGTTLGDLMRTTRGVDTVITGSGEMSFLDSLAGRATSSDSGWTYRVDGEFGERGIGSVKLHPPTTVTWKFGGWDDPE